MPDDWGGTERRKSPLVQVQSGGVGNGAKTFGGVIAVVALIAGIAAIVTPMYQSISSISEEMDRRLSVIEMRMIQDDVREIDDQRQSASQRERFKEVETQFKWLREIFEFKTKRGEEDVAKLSSWLLRNDERMGSTSDRLTTLEADRGSDDRGTLR